MKNQLNELVNVSRLYGNDPDYIIAGGGNSSFKTNDKIWVKSSGTSMADIEEDGFVCLDRKQLQVLTEKQYSSLPSKREEEVKADLKNAVLYPVEKRPSVETSLHEVISFPFIVHTHPALANGLLCSRESKKYVSKLFAGDSVLYIEYTDPGYVLFKKVHEELLKYRNLNGREPHIVFLENHGVFVGANSVEEITELYRKIEKILLPLVVRPPSAEDAEEENLLQKEVHELRTHFTNDFSVLPDASPMVRYFVRSKEKFGFVSKPFTPDNIVYCKSNYLFVGESDNLPLAIEAFKATNGFFPKIIGIEGQGLLALEQDGKSCRIAIDVFKDMMKIAWYANHFGGTRHLNQQQIDFIDNWEVENYRRQMSKKK